MSENYINKQKTKICKNCGKLIDLPICFNECKLRECQSFSGGYCYEKIGCRFGICGTHQIYLDKKY